MPLAPPNITTQPVTPPFIATEFIYKHDRYTKKTLVYITFYNPYSDYPTHVSFSNLFSYKPSLPLFFQNQHLIKILPIKQDHKIY